MSPFRSLWSALLLLLAAAGSLRAHEPYLLLTANADGTFTVEAGFSDGLSAQGLKIAVRDRGTGELLSEHRLPESAELRLKAPAVPYRVEFDGGTGHRISKPGPELEVIAPPSPPSAAAAESPAIEVTAASAPAKSPAPAITPRDDTPRMVLIAGIFFLFGSIAFALGYSSGRRAR